MARGPCTYTHGPCTSAPDQLKGCDSSIAPSNSQINAPLKLSVTLQSRLCNRASPLDFSTGRASLPCASSHEQLPLPKPCTTPIHQLQSFTSLQTLPFRSTSEPRCSSLPLAPLSRTHTPFLHLLKPVAAN